MSKFQQGDKVKIVEHPTKPEYCGLEGKITYVREGPKGVDVLNLWQMEGPRVPSLDKQDQYDIDVGPHMVYGCVCVVGLG